MRDILGARGEANDIQFFDGVKETLYALREGGYLLGITAHPAYVRLGWFEGAGIGSVWDAHGSSIDAGGRKPDPLSDFLEISHLLG